MQREKPGCSPLRAGWDFSSTASHRPEAPSCWLERGVCHQPNLKTKKPTNLSLLPDSNDQAEINTDKMFKYTKPPFCWKKKGIGMEDRGEKQGIKLG